MQCPRCSAENENNTRFCYNCGHQFTNIERSATQSAAVAMQPTSASNTYDYETVPSMPQAPGAPPPGEYYSYSSTSSVPVAAPNSTLAIVSLVFGIVSWVAIPFIGAIIAVICGHMARGEIRNSGGQVSGGGLAIAGMVLGYAQLALTILGVCAFVGLIMIGVSTSGY